jgi:hypothetical protein
MTTANRTSRGMAAATLALLALGCSPAPAAKIHEAAKPKQARVASGIARGASPLEKLTAPSLAEQTFDGEVREVLPAGPYVYLEIARSDGGEAWVTTLKRTAPASGARVRVKSFGSRQDFHSKRLGRSFDTLSFGIVYPIDENGEVALLSEEETR